MIKKVATEVTSKCVDFSSLVRISVLTICNTYKIVAVHGTCIISYSV